MEEEKKEDLLSADTGIPQTYGDPQKVINDFEALPTIETEEPKPEIVGRQTADRNPFNWLPNALKPAEFQEGFDTETGLVNEGTPTWSTKMYAGINDWVDNTFLGDKRTWDEVLEKRLNFEEESRKTAYQNRKEFLGITEDKPYGDPNAVSETVGVLLGAGLSNVEGIFELGELAGDLAKTVFKFGNVDPKNNVFSDKYEWANWNLGSEAFGAKSNVGKFASGLIQFASILRATGGFKGLQGSKVAGRAKGLYNQKTSKVLQRFWASSTTAQKFKLTAKAGFIGGLYGIPADVIMTITEPEQSNLSNLIEDMVPELKDSWLTSLAVDEDDSMAEAVVKTVFEGAGLGFAADAAGVLLVGNRVFKRLIGQGVDQTVATKNALYASKIAESNLSPNTLEKPPIPMSELLVPGETNDLIETALNPYKTEYDLYDLDELTTQIRSYSVDEQLDWYRQIPAGDRYNIQSFLSLDAQFREFGGTAKRIVEIPNGTKVEFDFQKGDYNANTKSIEISWRIFKEGYKGTDIRKGKKAWKEYIDKRNMGDLSAIPPDQQAIGPYGKDLITQLQRIVREEIRPGSILTNQPIEDIFTEGSAQARRLSKMYKDAYPQSKTIFNNLFDSDDFFWERVLEEYRYTGVIDSKEKVLDFVKNYNNKPDADTIFDALTEKEQKEWIKAYVEEGAIKGVKFPNIRQDVYQRAGFGDIVWTSQYGIVRSTPDAKGRWIAPVNVVRDVNGKFDDAAWEAQISALRSEHINNLQEAYKFVQATPNSIRKSKYSRVLEKQSKGIPVTYDDIVDVFQEYFIKGNRPAISAFNETTLTELTRVKVEDFYSVVLDPRGGIADINKSFVDIDAVSLSKFGREDIQNFLVKNQPLLSRDDARLYIAKENGNTVLKVVREFEPGDEAELLARAFDQPNIIKFRENTAGQAKGVLDPIVTDGKDLLKETEGNLRQSLINNPHDVRTATPTEAAAEYLQQHNGKAGQRIGGSRVLTNRQIKLLAEGQPEGVGDQIRELVKDTPIKLRELSEITQLTDKQILEEARIGMADALDEVSMEIDFEKLRVSEYAATGDILLTRVGIVQTRLLMQEMSKNIWNLSYNIMRMNDARADTFKQVEMLTQQWKALARTYKVSANAHSALLRASKIKLDWGDYIDNVMPPKNLAKLDEKLKRGEAILDKLVNRLGKGDPKARQEAMRIANALLLSDGDIAIQNRLWAHVGELSLGQAFKLYYNSLLSGPATHLVNITSNMFNTVMRPLAAATGGDIKSRKMAAAGFYGFQQTLKEAYAVMEKVYKNGGKAINDGDKGLKIKAEIDGKLELAKQSAALSDDFMYRRGVQFAVGLKELAEFPGFSWPSNLLVTADEFFKTLNARMEYNSRMMEIAIDQAEPGNLTEVFENLLKKNFEHNFDINTGAIKNDDLLQVSKELTFQTELEGPARVFARFVDEVPAMRIFFPFVKTGHNIMVYAGKHTPVVSRYLSESRAIMAGDDEYAKAVLKGQQQFGRFMIMGAGLACFNGILTGNGPIDREEREIWLRTHQPRSIKIGNTWIRYDRIEPLGQLLAGTADVVYGFNSGNFSENKAIYLIDYLSYALSANLTQKSFLQGLVPLGQILTPGQQGRFAFVRSGANILNSFIPLSSARRTLSNMITPYYREFTNEFERVLYQASGGLARNLGADKYDWLSGEKIGNDNGGINSLLPLKVNWKGDDVVRNKLLEIEFDSSYIIKELGGIKLNAEQKAYFAKHMGESRLYDLLKNYLTHPSFDVAVENYKERLRNGENLKKENELWYKQIVNIINLAKRDAINATKQQFPELNKEINDAKLLRQSQVNSQIKDLTNF